MRARTRICSVETRVDINLYEWFSPDLSTIREFRIDSLIKCADKELVDHHEGN